MAKLYTTKEAAEKLGQSYDHVRKLLSTKKPAQVNGSTKFWTLKQIESVRAK